MGKKQEKHEHIMLLQAIYQLDNGEILAYYICNTHDTKDCPKVEWAVGYQIWNKDWVEV